MRCWSARAGALFLGAGLLLGITRPASGQQPAGNAAACRDQLLPMDTVIDTIFTWQPRRLRHESQALFDFRAIQERTALGMVPAPPRLGRRDAAATPYGLAPPGAEHLADAEALVWFQLGNDGRVTGMKLERRSGWSALNVALQRAVLRADSLRSFAALPSDLAGQPIDLWLAAGFHRLRNAVSVPLARVPRAEPRHTADVVAPRFIAFDRAGRPPAGRGSVADRLMLEFVVDTMGRAVPESARPFPGSSGEYLLDALRVLRTARFSPARVGRCLVPARASLPVTFTR